MDFTTSGTRWPARLDVNYHENIHLIDGYLSAARILVEAVQEKEYLSDQLIYPIIYLYRHHLELKLKSIWRSLWKLRKLDHDYPKHHRLLDIWLGCRDKITKMTDISHEDQQVVLSCLKEFAEFDPTAESFRFHEQKDGKQIGETLPALDIIPVAKQIDYCVEILEGIMVFLFDEVDMNDW